MARGIRYDDHADDPIRPPCFPARPRRVRARALLQQDPHIRFFNNQRGHVRHVVTLRAWQADFQVLDKVSVPDGRMSTRKSFVIESGQRSLAEV